MDNRQKFLITCAPRTGSTMLRMMLNSHPDIVCHGEVITVKGKPNLGKYADTLAKTDEELAQLMAEDATRFLYDYVWGDPNCSAIGCKIKYRQLEEQFPDLFKAVLTDKNIKIVHLKRRNLLKRYVSNRLAGSQKTPTVILERGHQDDNAQQKIVIHVKKCIQDIEAIKQSEIDFANYFAEHPVFDVYYEDLTLSDGQELNKLQVFLGVKPLAIQPKTVKVNSNNLADLIENYDEIKRALADTIYGEYLRS